MSIGLLFFCSFSSFFSLLGVAYAGLAVNHGRKDTYGVYAEPVDPEEVSRIYFESVGSTFLFGILVCFEFNFFRLSKFLLILQLPDYHDVIEHPMDFATVRKKLANGSYSTLEQFEVCVHGVLRLGLCS